MSKQPRNGVYIALEKKPVLVRLIIVKSPARAMVSCGWTAARAALDSGHPRNGRCLSKSRRPDETGRRGGAGKAPHGTQSTDSSILIPPLALIDGGLR